MIGVLGCGNMAGAIVKGIHQHFPDIKFLTYTPSEVRAIKLAKEVNGEVIKDLEVLNQCEVVFIGCKPQQFSELSDKIRGIIKNKNIHFVSMMAAIDLETLSRKLGVNKVSRIMPNTPILFGDGVTLMIHHPSVVEDQKSFLENLFNKVGSLYLIEDESRFDKVMTVTGSGPAYVFLFAKTLIDKLISWGIDEKSAKEMTIGMFSGSVEMMKNSTQDLSTLISQVTSKGGTTIEAIRIYEENKLDLITSVALEAALNRSGQLTKEFNK